MSKVFIHRFDSWKEFTDKVSTGKHNSMSPTTSQNKESYNNWFGTTTYEEAISLLDKGWQKGIDKVKEIQATLPATLFDGIMPVRDYKPEARHDVAGGILDVAAHITGATPEVFITEKPPVEEDNTKVMHGKKLQTIYMSLVNSAMCSEKAFLYRGAYTFALIEHLENCGFSTEVWGVSPVSGCEINQKTYVKIKTFGELFDVNKMAISLTSSFMLRRYLFRIMECASDMEVQDITCRSYGYPWDIPFHEVVLQEDQDLNPIWINTHNTEDKDVMLRRFEEILKNHIEGGVIQA